MANEDLFHRAPDDFDPDKTLFFQRRGRSVKLLPLLVVCTLLLGSGALIVWAFNQPGKNGEEAAASAHADKERPVLTPEQTLSLQNPPRAEPVAPRAQPVPPRAEAVGTPAPFDATKPVRAALPVGVPPAGLAAETAGNDLPPTVPDANSPLNLDVKDPGNAQVRAEVLRRIDLMPGISAVNKDKLYASVDHARGMGRVLTIPFTKGEAAVRPADVDRLKEQIASPAIRPTLDDPTAVFVVLGYADPKGSDKVNADVSLSRARSVLDALRDRCGVQNVMHAVAMGGSTLFSANQAEKNRVVEVWAVLP